MEEAAVQLSWRETRTLDILPLLCGVSMLSRPALADVLKPLFQHLKARSSSWIEVPALFHDVVHHLRTSIGTIHLIPFFHPRNDLFQRLKQKEDLFFIVHWYKHYGHFLNLLPQRLITLTILG